MRLLSKSSANGKYLPAEQRISTEFSSFGLRQVLPLSLAALLIIAGAARAQDYAVPLGENNGPATFRPASELPPPGPSAFVIGGRPVNPASYRATLVANSDDGLCTASVIAPTVVLTAAHCVGHRQPISIAISGAQPIEGSCDHPIGRGGYAEDKSADYALCLLQAPMQLARFETINTSPARITAGARASLTGYGCTAAGGGVDRVLRSGGADIRAVPSEVQVVFEVGGPVLAAPNYFRTRGDAAICPGDSGGATYIDGNAEDRQIIGVNSRVLFTSNESFLSSTSTEFALNFFRDWARSKGVFLCGVHPGEAVRCR